MVQGQADVGNGVAREGGEVPDGLNFGVQFPAFLERGRPGTKAKLRPFYGNGVPEHRLPNGSLTPTRAKDAPPAPTDSTSDEDVGGKYLRRVADCRTKAGQTGGVPQLMDLGGDVEAH